VKLQSVLKLAYRKLATYLSRRKLLLDDDLIYFLTHPELRQLIHSPEAAQTLVQKVLLNSSTFFCFLLFIFSSFLSSRSTSSPLRLQAVQRRHTLPRQMELQFKEVNISRPVPLPRLDEEEKEKDTSPTAEGNQKKKNKVLKGTPVSAGVVTGKARVARSLEEAQHIQPGEILIVPFTDVAWTPLFAIAGGLATEIGGVVSHGAVVAREYALPCIVAVPGATRAFRTGETLKLNGDTGTLTSVTTTEE
jgi:phosphohistidine swiveling domain-containing protein